jgi:acyl-CoA reductase-like NAD-dependent aldehyde dehydrogenase
MKLKLAFATAMKARRAWAKVPPEQRRKLVDSASVQVRTHGPAVAKKLSDTAKTHGPAVAKKLSDTARTQGPVAARKLTDTAREKGPIVARRISDTLERTLNKPPSS